jgi:excisionase family DNA binding protein
MPVYKSGEELPHDKSKFLTIKEASEAIGLGGATIRNLIIQGKIGAFKRKWRYGVYQRSAWFIPVSELKRYLTKELTEKLVGKITWKPPKAS